MSEATPGADPLAGWDPRRRQALEGLWATFGASDAHDTILSDELINERRAEARAEDSRAPTL